MPRWTAEARRKQSEAIRQWQPWQQSTGPVTPHGKLQSARNGPHHAPRAPGQHPAELRKQARQWWDFLRLQRQMVRWGIAEADDIKTVCSMILAIEHDLGIPQADTERRVIRTLRAQVRNRF